MSFIVRHIFRKLWEYVGRKDRERISKLRLPEGVYYKSFRYIEDGDEMHTLSVYWPEDYRGELPVIIDIHGGGWMYGSKEVNRPFDMALASLGFLVIGLSYRLAPRTHLKGMLEDIVAASNWAYEHRSEFKADFERVFLTGDSAGAHLLSILTALNYSESLRKATGLGPLPFKIRAINLNHGVVYLEESSMRSRGRIVNYFGRKEIIKELYGGTLQRDRELYRLTCDFDTLLDSCPLFPPSHILTSTGDWSFHDQSLKIYGKLIKKGQDVKLVDVEKERHVFNVMYIDSPAGIEANRGITDFFLEHQRGA